MQQSQTLFSMMHNHSTETYNKGYTVEIKRNVMQCSMSKASMQACSMLAVDVWVNILA